MASTKELHRNIFDQLLAKDIILDEKILDYKVFCDEDCKDVIIKISTEDVEYNLSINLTPCNEKVLMKLENVEEHLSASGKVEGVHVAIKDVFINGYDVSDFVTSNVNNIKSVLRSYAHKHASSIKQQCFKGNLNQMQTSLSREHYKDTLRQVIGIIDVDNMEHNTLEYGIKSLTNLSYQQRAKTFYCVPSYSNENRLIFQSQDGSGICKIVNRGSQVYFPLVYDVLLTIFQLSTQKLRQCYFHELIQYYYHTLGNILNNLGLELSSIIPIEEYERQIKYFLPLVKLDTAYNCCQLYLKCVLANKQCTNCNTVSVCEDLVKVTISELYECIMYPNLNREDCYQIIKNKIGSSKYQFIRWSMTQLQERPGFLGDYFKLTIKIMVDGDENILNLFAKYLPTTSDVMIDLATTSFQKEVFFYATFMSELKRLGLDGILDFAPVCYFSRSNDVLVFEDLSLRNYKCLKKTEPMSYENIKFIIKQLVKLHACAILYEEKLSEKYKRVIRIDDKYSKYLQEVNLQIEEVNGNSKITIVGIHAIMNYVLDTFPEIPKRMSLETFKSKVTEAYNSLFRKVKKADRFRNVICQGDFWASNIMFKLKEDGTPDDCRIIDYQLVRYCPPTHDLFFLIYVNTDKDFRSKYMDKLIDEYYSELSKTVEKYNVDINKIYTYQEFLECCKYMKPAAICIATLYYPITLCPDEKIQDILTDEERTRIAFSEDRKEVLEELNHEGPYRQRIKEIIEDLYEICEAEDY